MAISIRSSGTTTTGTTANVSVPYPATITAGDLLVLGVATKYQTVSWANLGAGWWFQGSPGFVSTPTNVQATNGANGIDTGTIDVMMAWKVATGAETGNLTVTPGNNNVSVCKIICFQKAADKTWDIGTTTVNTTYNGTSISATVSSLNAYATGLFANGDQIHVLAGQNNDTYASTSTQTFSFTGSSTSGLTEQADTVTSSGQDMGFNWWTVSLTGGTFTHSDTITIAQTNGTTYATGAYAGYILRLREVDITDPCGSTGMFGF